MDLLSLIWVMNEIDRDVHACPFHQIVEDRSHTRARAHSLYLSIQRLPPIIPLPHSASSKREQEPNLCQTFGFTIGSSTMEFHILQHDEGMKGKKDSIIFSPRFVR
jgi:hypothetical protein